MNTIWLVTHGETGLQDEFGRWIPDPGMTPAGEQQVTALKSELPIRRPPEVHCGTGRRQFEVAQCLGLAWQENFFFSSLWGDASTLVKVDGQRMVLLSHRELVPYKSYLSASHVGKDVISGVIAKLPHGSIICSGRPVLVRLGMDPAECKNGALYALDVSPDGKVSVRHVFGGITLPS